VTDRIQRHLLPDDSLLLDVDPRLERAVSSWVALDSCRSGGRASWESRLLVHHAPAPVEAPHAPPTLRVGSVAVWMAGDAGRAILGATERDCGGAVSFADRQATLVASDAAGPRLHTALTFATALLLGRLGHALVHAAAVVQPGGGAWLLAGGAGSGEQAAFTHLTLAGWPGLATRRVVLREVGDDGAMVAVGLPGRAGAAEMVAGWPRHVGSADLAGVLLLRPTPSQPTVLVRLPEVDLLTALAPESPWLRLDRSGATGVLRAIHGGLRLPTFELRQGLDTYADPRRLAEVLESLPRGGSA
jgi:hypothetical protein